MTLVAVCFVVVAAAVTAVDAALDSRSAYRSLTGRELLRSSSSRKEVDGVVEVEVAAGGCVEGRALLLLVLLLMLLVDVS